MSYLPAKTAMAFFLLSLHRQFFIQNAMEHTQQQPLIRFDWALKRLLRNKANFDILEGFLSALLKEDIRIDSIGESEGNQSAAADKFNRVDILAYNSRQEVIIIELQVSYEADYWFRMVYGACKAVADHIGRGQDYGQVRKVFHINIVYFEIGQGADYVYHGKNEFRGVHTDDVLQLTPEQQEHFGKREICDLFPEYYILRVNDFNDNAKDSLDEWIYYLKNDRIPKRFEAKGLEQVRERLLIDGLTKQERLDYEHHLNQTIFESSVIKSNYQKGRFEGMQEGRSEGLQEGEARGIEKGRDAERLSIARTLLGRGLSEEDTAQITGLTIEQVRKIKS